VFGIAVVFGMPVLFVVAGVLLVDSGWPMSAFGAGIAVLAWPAAAVPMMVTGRVPPRHERSAAVSLWIAGWCFGIVVLMIGAVAAFWLEFLRGVKY